MSDVVDFIVNTDASLDTVSGPSGDSPPGRSIRSRSWLPGCSTESEASSRSIACRVLFRE